MSPTGSACDDSQITSTTLPEHPPDDAPARLGSRIGNYVLKQVIGRGGMGIVYAAEHVYIHKPAAVKVLHPRYFDHPEARQRFLREAQTASVVDHPNIIGINDFGEAPDGTVYLVMSQVEGVGLDEVLRENGRLPLFRSLGILNQVTRALAAAHDKGVVHRDLKPENIMLAARAGRREIVRQVEDGEGSPSELVETEPTYDFVTVLDFGAAKFWHQSASPLEDGGVVIGTPAYMAPETARLGIADARSDVYAVGVIFYEMLTGSVPFDGEDAVQIMVRHVHEPVEPPRRRSPYVEITEDAERLILRALEKQPEGRHATMAELNLELQRCYGSIRFRRAATVATDVDFDSLRRRIALTPDKVKRRTTPQEPLPARARPPSGSGPVLLTKAKAKRPTGKHKTLPFLSTLGEGSPPVPEDES